MPYNTRFKPKAQLLDVGHLYLVVVAVNLGASSAEQRPRNYVKIFPCIISCKINRFTDAGAYHFAACERVKHDNHS